MKVCIAYIAYGVNLETVLAKAQIKELCERDGWESRVTIVIDCPEENFLPVLMRAFDQVLVSRNRQGFGRARRAALSLCALADSDWNIIADADEQYSLESIYEFIGEIVFSSAQSAIPQRSRVDLPEPISSEDLPSRRLVEAFENYVVAFVVGRPELRWMDMQTGLYALRKELVWKCLQELDSPGFRWDLYFSHWILANGFHFIAPEVMVGEQLETRFSVEDLYANLDSLFKLAPNLSEHLDRFCSELNLVSIPGMDVDCIKLRPFVLSHLSRFQK
jgi:hypothetical protein